MEDKSYLIFSLHGLHYGVDAYLVQEIFFLPEFTPVVEAPSDIVGILNLRGKILPLMDLDLRSGHQPQEYRLSDSVIVVEWDLRIGLIVNSVHEVKNINSEAIEGETSYLFGRERGINSRFITGVAKLDADMIMLLNPDKLLRDSEMVEVLLDGIAMNGQIEESTTDSESEQNGKELENQQRFAKFSILNGFYAVFCPNATPEERAIFWERAENLRLPTESSDFTGLMAVAVIGLNGEYFGLDLEVVREFINIRNITSIPCCPARIIGNINLRGEIVTIVDIRGALNMPITVSTASKAVVIHVDEEVAGVPIDDVFDIMYLCPSDLIPIHKMTGGRYEYLQGTALYSEKILSILDLPKMLSKEVFTVNEQV